MRRIARQISAHFIRVVSTRQQTLSHVRAMTSATNGEETVDDLSFNENIVHAVCCLDPRIILQREKLQDLLDNKSLYTSMKVPSSFLDTLSQGAMELGDMDDPMNNWYFGQKDEIFKYRLLGTHPTMSGFTCIIEQDQLAKICAGHQTAGLPDWEDFKADLQAGLIQFPSVRTPFLFAGTVLDAPAAAVYQLKQNGKVVGVCVSSEAAGD